jgi:hypothetical protein
MEVLCLAVQIRRETKELYAMHTVVQAVLACQHPESKNTGEGIRESFETFKHALMPFLKNEVKREHDKVIEVMNEEMKRGPMVVQAIAPMKVSSRLRNRVLKEVEKPLIRRKGW